MYDVNPDVNVFFNTGLVEKAPILDNVIDYSGNVATDPDNEKFLHNEFGVNYRRHREAGNAERSGYRGHASSGVRDGK